MLESKKSEGGQTQHYMNITYCIYSRKKMSSILLANYFIGELMETHGGALTECKK
jgi:hypothetical protein